VTRRKQSRQGGNVEAESLSKRRLEGSRWRGGTRREVQASFGTAWDLKTGFRVRRIAVGADRNENKFIDSRTQTVVCAMQEEEYLGRDTRVRPRTQTRDRVDCDQLLYEVSSRLHIV
jgi:hypothetical protein